MSRVLSELLAAEEPLFSLAIKQLEQAGGNQSVDVRLTAEIIGKVHIKMRSLGLDPADTTGSELYRTLYNLIQKHDRFLAERIGCNDPEDVHEVLMRVKDTIAALDIPKKAWVVKHSVIKRLLKAKPPTHVMKHLGYRSVDSLIKREPIGELLGAVRLLESEDWQHKFIRSYKKLRPTDFETRNIEVIYFDPDKWGTAARDYVRKHRHNITHLKETGTIIMLPMPLERMPGITITALPLLLHYVNEIRLYSSFFKSNQVRPDFAEKVIHTLIHDPGKHASVGGQHVHWRVIHRHFGAPDRDHPDIFEPHVEADDLIWRRTEETLYRLEPALHFWYDVEYVGVRFGEQQISFNLMDMAVSYVNRLAYGHHSVHHMRESLWNEIYMRYMGESIIEKQVLKQLDRDTIEPDILAVSLSGDV